MALKENLRKIKKMKDMKGNQRKSRKLEESGFLALFISLRIFEKGFDNKLMLIDVLLIFFFKEIFLKTR